jgi:hypothetical protein
MNKTASIILLPDKQLNISTIGCAYALKKEAGSNPALQTTTVIAIEQALCHCLSVEDKREGAWEAKARARRLISRTNVVSVPGLSRGMAAIIFL